MIHPHSNRKKLIGLISLKLGWLACVGGAALGLVWLGPATVALLVAVHLKMIDNVRSEIALIVRLAAVAFLLDSGLAALGLLSYSGASAAPAAPLWIVALWCLLATTLRSSLGWLEGRVGLAAVAGTLAGPLGYLAADRLGAVSLGSSRAIAVAAIAVAWGMAIPVAVWLSQPRRLEASGAMAPQ